jgi:hypothetical protein
MSFHQSKIYGYEAPPIIIDKFFHTLKEIRSVYCFTIRKSALALQQIRINFEYLRPLISEARSAEKWKNRFFFGLNQLVDVQTSKKTI